MILQRGFTLQEDAPGLGTAIQNRMSAGMRESSLQGRIYGVFWMAVPNPGASSWRVKPLWRIIGWDVGLRPLA
jgi:hypothetical protein